LHSSGFLSFIRVFFVEYFSEDKIFCLSHFEEEKKIRKMTHCSQIFHLKIVNEQMRVGETTIIAEILINEKLFSYYNPYG